jgi:histidinol-phosphatase
VARYDDDLRFAHVLADAADDITTRRFRALDLRVETKPDLTPVSDADRAAEESLRNVLRRARPRDAVLGEELGRSGAGPRCWVLDPIDGTKNYVRGVPVWATLIGLMDGPDVVVGVVSAPALGRRWWGALGGGAWTGRSLTKASPCRVSGVTKLGDASLSYSGIGGWAERGLLDNFLGLAKSVWRTRAFGDFWSHMLVAEGACDVSAEPEVSLWDMAAIQVIVTEAGGRFTSLEGEATPDGGSVVCTNGHLHDEVLAQLANHGIGSALVRWGLPSGVNSPMLDGRHKCTSVGSGGVTREGTRRHDPPSPYYRACSHAAAGGAHDVVAPRRRRRRHRPGARWRRHPDRT